MQKVDKSNKPIVWTNDQLEGNKFNYDDVQWCLKFQKDRRYVSVIQLL